MPSLAIVANSIDDTSSIGSIAAWDAREALARHWSVYAVCERLDPNLVSSVTHVPLFVPPRVHLIQYALGRTATRMALRRISPDVIVTHQPQSASLSDVWNVHYLERAAHQATRDLAVARHSWMKRPLGAGVLRLEDHYVGSLPDSTLVMFCSEPLQNAFVELYGSPSRTEVFPNPSLSALSSIDSPDVAERRRLTGGSTELVVGFLGGADPRKGLDVLVGAINREADLFGLLAGPALRVSLGPRTRSLGELSDVDRLLRVVDALVVPSRFEPFGLVVLEAAAKGVPVIVSPAVGSAPLVDSFGAGLLWDGRAPLTPLVKEAVARRSTFAAGGALLVRALAKDQLADRRFEAYASIAHAK